MATDTKTLEQMHRDFYRDLLFKGIEAKIINQDQAGLLERVWMQAFTGGERIEVTGAPLHFNGYTPQGA